MAEIDTKEAPEGLSFDAIFLGYEDKPGGDHLETAKDVVAARKAEDGPLLLSNEAEKFCIFIVHHGYMPSEAYDQAFSTRDENNMLIRPNLPAYSSRMLLKQPEVRERIEEIRAEIRTWGKTTVEEVEANYRRIALNPDTKDSDRVAATKALCALRGFDAQPDNAPGTTININLPFTPQALGNHRVIEHERS